MVFASGLRCGLSSLSLFALSSLVAGSLLLPSNLFAKDYFLTIGGGYSPYGNQISLEKNAQLFQRLLGESYGVSSDGIDHTVFFSDGNDVGRDLQFADPDRPKAPAHELLAKLSGNTKYFELDFRSHQVDNVTGGSNKTNLNRWFEDIGSKLTEGDRLLIYATAHGGKSTDKNKPYETGLYLWNQQRLGMSEFAGLLKKVPANVPVTLVMVQCYSGGFSHLIFEDGDDKKGPTAARRAGFFATVHDRPAAGCTPDINEENYHEYSTYFWEAIRGKTRTDEPITKPDYDSDGQVSFAEAHAYALIHSVTIDISVCTSDAFLRELSHLRNDRKDSDKDLAAASDNFNDLLAAAKPATRQVLLELSDELELEGHDRLKAAQDLLKKVDGEKRSIDGQRGKLQATQRDIRKSIGDALKNRWPELANPWHPRVAEILTREGDAVVAFAKSQPKYSEFESLDARIDSLSEQKMDLDRKWVKAQRLIRVLENVALEMNLPKVAEPETVTRYEQLLSDEAACFGPVSPGQLSTAETSPTP